MQADLEVYQAESGQWSGVFYEASATDVGVGVAVELGRVAGCSTPEEVIEVVSEQYEVVTVK